MNLCLAFKDVTKYGLDLMAMDVPRQANGTRTQKWERMLESNHFCGCARSREYVPSQGLSQSRREASEQDFP